MTTHQILNYGQSEDVPVIGNDEDGFVVSTIELFVSSNFVPDHLPFVAFDLPADRRAAVGVRRLLVVGLRPEASRTTLGGARRRPLPARRSRRAWTSPSGWGTSSTRTSRTMRRPTAPGRPS